MRALASILVAVIVVACGLQPACALQCSFPVALATGSRTHVPHCGESAPMHQELPDPASNRGCGHDSHHSTLAGPVESGLFIVSPATLPLFVNSEKGAPFDQRTADSTVLLGSGHSSVVDPGIALAPLRV